MPNEFVARNGIIALNNSTITGSLIVTGSITGSLSGSVDGTASYATTASFALNAGVASAASNLIFSGSVTASVDVAGTTFRLISGSSTFLFVSSSGNIGVNVTVPTSRLQVSGTTNVVNFRGSGSNAATSSIFTVDGAAGRLFSVNDSLSGSLFSVNTIAGLPVMEAFSDNTVRIGQYGQRALFVSQSRVGINKETSLTANLDISGSVNITGSLTTTGTITAQTLVVQTITSSTDFVTGSTRFGTIISNTHQFTGSISVSGSITGTPGVTNNLTASNAISSSFAISASWAPSVGGGFTLLATASYTSSGTFEWNKPTGAQIISLIVVGAGGGGASGAAAVGSGVAGGTGGGGGGGVVMLTLPASSFNATESIIVGAGGAGGTAVSRVGAGANATTAGNTGSNGGDSVFGEIVAAGGKSGSYTAANNVLALGGAPIGFPSFTTDSAAAGYTIDTWTAPIAISGPGGSGAATDKSPAAVAALTMSAFVPTGGGFGGTPGNTTTDENGGSGGFSNTSFGLVSGGSAGTSGVAGGNGNLAGSFFGTGGGGGFGDYAASGTATATNGGTGSIGAGGGGGGSARSNSTLGTANGGAGGLGGNGAVFVYVYG